MKWFTMSDGTLVNADNADFVTPLVKNDLNATISFTVVFQGGTKLNRSYVLKDRADLTEETAT